MWMIHEDGWDRPEFDLTQLEICTMFAWLADNLDESLRIQAPAYKIEYELQSRVLHDEHVNIIKSTYSRQKLYC